MKYSLMFVAALTAFGFGQRGSAAAANREAQDFIYLGASGPVLIRFHVRIDGKPFVEVWEDFIGKLFAYLDLNSDGVLSKEEVARLPPLQVLFTRGVRFVGQSPNVGEAIDKNKDGTITRAELADWYRRNGAAPFQFQASNAPRKQQFVTYIVGSRPLSADALNEKFFVLLDTNKDGKLSREELGHSPAILHKLDADDDEMVSTQEMSGNVAQGQTVFAVTEVLQEGGNNIPFLMVSPDRASKEVARELLNQYAPKGQKPGSRRLTRQNVKLDEATFAQLDADEDGTLDSEELARFARRAPDLEFRIRLGKKADNEAAVEVISPKHRSPSLTKAIRPGTGGTLLMEFGTTQIELGNGTESGNIPLPARIRQQYLAQFRMADKDNNGYLDNTEAAQNSLYRNQFKRMDRDGDGKLFEKEVIAYLDKMKELQEAALRSCASLAVKDQGRGLFDLVDTNNDGRLSVREMRRMVELASSLDRDGDGQFSRAEIPHKYRVDVRQGPANGDALNARVLTLRRMSANEPELPERTAGPRWFRKMDRNHDGDVSRREFLGTAEAFHKIDADGDGLISVEEAERADKRFRKAKETE